MEREYPKRYYVLWSKTHNDTLNVHTTYPKKVVKYFYMINKRKGTQSNTTMTNPNNTNVGRPGQSSQMFLQHNQEDDKHVQGIYGRMMPHITYYTCSMIGHY